MSFAAFDLDGTLTVRDCVFPFLHQVSGRGFVPKTLVRRAPSLAAALARRDRDVAKLLVLDECFRGKDAERIAAMGSAYADRVAENWLRRDTLARLRWHQSEGHRVVLVSASLDVYVRPLADILGIPDVLCTALEVVDGVHTGGIVGENCRGVEKVRRVESWASMQGLSGEGWLTHAYGDSSGDVPMLRLARQGHLVKRRELSPSC